MLVSEITVSSSSLELSNADLRDRWKKHTNKFRVTVKYNGNKTSFNYYMGSACGSRPSKRDVLDSLILDSRASEYSLTDFASEFGYDDIDEAEKVKRACERMYDKAHKLFTDEELDEIYEWVRE